MNSDLKITIEQRQAAVPVTVFSIRGWLDGQSEEQLLEVSRTAYEEGARYLLIDMSDLDTITSAGIRAIQKLYQMYTPKEDRFKIATNLKRPFSRCKPTNNNRHREKHQRNVEPNVLDSLADNT